MKTEVAAMTEFRVISFLAIQEWDSLSVNASDFLSVHFVLYHFSLPCIQTAHGLQLEKDGTYSATLYCSLIFTVVKVI